jgi:hypothetical protein
MSAKRQSEQILKASPFRDNERCGIYLTRMQQKKNQEKGVVTELSKGLQSRKRIDETQTCEGLGMRCKMARPSTSLRDKDISVIGGPITDKAQDQNKPEKESLRSYQASWAIHA